MGEGEQGPRRPVGPSQPTSSLSGTGSVAAASNALQTLPEVHDHSGQTQAAPDGGKEDVAAPESLPASLDGGCLWGAAHKAAPADPPQQAGQVIHLVSIMAT